MFVLIPSLCAIYAIYATYRSRRPSRSDTAFGEARRWHVGRMGVDRAVLFRLATSERLERAVKAVPGGEAFAWRAASRYVAGRSRAEALQTAAGLLSDVATA